MIGIILVVLVAILHVYFLVLEMFLWDKPYGMATFGHSEDFARQSKPLAMNQGLYNGFLTAGLLWGLSLGEAGKSIVLFFLGCVIVAGVFGGLTVSRRIFFIQAVPALVAVVLVVLSV